MIGVLGGYGAVGGHAARLLARWGAGPLRIGGRDDVRAKQLAAQLPHAEAVVSTPVTRPRSPPSYGAATWW